VAGFGPRATAPPGHVRVPAPNRPVTWPVRASNPPLPSGKLAERNATLKVFSWADRINPRCLDDFAQKSGCQVELTTFSTFGQALATLRGGRDIFDVLLGAPTYAIGPLVGHDLLRPLNHRYLPNLRNLWPQVASPYYDVGMRYTVPYTVYTTGIAWRRDLVDADPYAMANGWAFPWVAGARGKTALLDDYRESIGLALIKAGADINTTDPYLLDAAQAQLASLRQLVGIRVDNNPSAEIAAGQTAVHLAWSGQVAAAHRFLPNGVPVEAIGYWFPPSGIGPVGNDTATVLRGAQSPVLAHLFINYLLDSQNAMVNISRIGFVQPLTYVTPARLVYEGILPRSLMSTAVLSTYQDHGLKKLQLPVAADALWRQIWNSVGTRRGKVG
jgi:spermidine/putrescine transport system substrate-binding protein